MNLMEDERQQDVKEIATRMLEWLKTRFGEDAASNDTPQGRMIYQLEWVLRTQKEGILFLPVDERMIGTLTYCYTEFGDTVVPRKDGERLLNLLADGNYLMKPEHFHFVIKEVDEMLAMIPPHYPEIYRLIHARWSETPDDYDTDKAELWALMAGGEAAPERKGLAAFPLITDLRKMRADFEAGTIDPPIETKEREQRYPAFDTAFSESLFEDEIPGLYIKFRRISALVVDGRRPGPDGIIPNTEGWGRKWLPPS